MKYEWRKQDKELYLPKNTPTIINVPTMNYLMISGTGNPNSDDFKAAVEALYTVSYAIKMAPKKQINIDGYFDYTVFPLEGVWDLDEEGIIKQQNGVLISELKNHFIFTVMIRQPEFVTSKLVEQIKSMQFQAKKNKTIKEVTLHTIEEKLCCQMMHLGPYDDEPKSFDLMEKHCDNLGYQRKSKAHKEIYISNPQRVAPEKLKTVIRFSIKNH